MTSTVTRLTAPNGATVVVSDAKAQRLIAQGFSVARGFTPADTDEKKTRTRRATPQTTQE